MIEVERVSRTFGKETDGAHTARAGTVMAQVKWMNFAAPLISPGDICQKEATALHREYVWRYLTGRLN